MFNSSPFFWVNEARWPGLLAVLTCLLVALSATLSMWGEVLITQAAPTGIVSFELAWSQAAAASILSSWGPEARESAFFVQGIDSLYLLVYPAWLSLASVLLGRALEAGWVRLGLGVGWAALLAAPCDAIENYALIQELRLGASAGFAQVAAAAGVAKFAFVVLAAAFVLIAGAALAVRRLMNGARA